jgi:hypothetical protein
VNMSGRYRKWSLAAAVALTLIGAIRFVVGTGEKPMTQVEDEGSDFLVRIPDEAVYLGTDMGGEFVVLRRQDIQLDTGRILPAFHIEMYWAGAKGKPYGIDRIGGHIYTGLGLYVPPQALVDEIGEAAFEPPHIDFIFGEHEGEPRSGVSSDVFFIHLKSRRVEGWRNYIGHIVPLNLDLRK